ncbi:phytanoyl-CoA dioxygenase family protein [Engelhardtia mirabilis]|uniref:Phytanoyl-CoA dioxygenase (PhyH) n=1 Tax=Engelhardtia mirabilis TaxID=2528011 RepID=A0A518BP40_9BACT|nr:Phytanoyl-CoA dioxygenase (PhyH) [Planctomycetes bacterium Pla133]QDV03066.1 Phytanoyl-CoA dioxygenase (PhyH) [Planctomycetes bacterium Pla86]
MLDKLLSKLGQGSGSKPEGNQAALPELPWYDLPGADERLESEVDATDRATIRTFRTNGFVQLPGAVEPERLDALLASIDEMWTLGDPRVWVEHYKRELVDGKLTEEVLCDPVGPRWRGDPHKMLDLHVHSAAAREVLASPQFARWLHLLLGPKVVAFQSLVFDRGTEQGMHRDTNFVGLRPAWQMIAAWIALEDIEEGSGELQYFTGSNHLPDYTFPHGGNYLGVGQPLPGDYCDHWHLSAAERGLECQRFLPKKGDVLIWHAGLVHGGSPITKPDATRRSFVTHFAPEGAVPAYIWGGGECHRVRQDEGLSMTAVVRGA